MKRGLRVLVVNAAGLQKTRFEGALIVYYEDTLREGGKDSPLVLQQELWNTRSKTRKRPGTRFQISQGRVLSGPVKKKNSFFLQLLGAQGASRQPDPRALNGPVKKRVALGPKKKGKVQGRTFSH